jgi:hypothetical protein
MGGAFNMVKRQRGQSAVLIALLLIFFLIPMAALAIDLPSLWMTRREFQKLADAACLAGALAAQNDPLNVEAAILQSFADNDVDSSLYSPQEGTGVSLGRGYEWTSTGDVRVALWGPTLSWFSHFIPGVDGWEVGARAHCEKGIGGFLPLALKEHEEPGTRILQSPDANDEWSGPCPNQAWNRDRDFLERDPQNCWVYGDWQILAGDGHVPNDGAISMNGLIAPDVRCQDDNGLPLDQFCEVKVYIPPAPEGAAVNTLKALTMSYIEGGGYPGYLPWVGDYDAGVHSPLIAQMEGVSNNMLAQAINETYGIGDLLIVFVYDQGVVHPASKNFEYVEVIGYAVVEIVYTDANTVAVIPEYPAPATITSIYDGSPEWNGLDGLLPDSLEAIAAAGYNLHAILIPWD